MKNQKVNHANMTRKIATLRQFATKFFSLSCWFLDINKQKFIFDKIKIFYVNRVLNLL